MKQKIKPLKIKRCYIGESGVMDDFHQDLLEGYWDMGYFLYEDPTHENFIIISDVRLTYGGLKKHARRFDIDLLWWQEQTDFNEHLDMELDEIVI